MKKLRNCNERVPIGFLSKKTIRVMKMTLVLSILTIVQLGATESYSQTAKISLELKDVKISEALNEIEDQSEFYFLYSPKLIDVERRVDIIAENKPIKDILTDLFGSIVMFAVKDRQIILSPIENSGLISLLQQRQITGTITDEKRDPLPGVSIKVKGMTLGTLSDASGKYTINDAPQNSIIIFSFIGMETQEIPSEGKTLIDVVLKEASIGLEEVVVVGYGVNKKVNLTGAVSTVTSAKLEGRPITNMSNALSGLSTGVQINQSTGQPGRDGATIRIRGIGTWVNANPLVLIDGIESSMANVSSDDVENISVLKDAAASAIYGSRAANGVILITTKKGGRGELKASYHGYLGWQKATKIDDYVSDFALFMELNNEANINVGIAAAYTQSDIDAWRGDNDPLLHPNVDWIAKVYGNVAQIQSHHFSFAGGSDKSEYNFSLGYADQDGIAPTNKMKRYDFRLNWESALSKKLKIGTNLSGSWANINDPLIAQLFGMVPGIPWVQNEDGRWGGAQSMGTGSVMNPRASWTNDSNEERILRFLGKVYLNWDIVEGLKLSANAAIKFNNSLKNKFDAKYDLWNFNANSITRTLGDPQTAVNTNTEDYTLTNYYTLNYTKTFGNGHNLNVLGGSSIEVFRNDQFQGSVQKFHSNEIRVLSGGQLNPQVNGNSVEWTLLSYFGRLNYDFNSRYLFEANLRYDGSSKFREGNRWDAYPSFSAGWRISQEDFMKNVAWIENLKLRASWGTLGNQNLNTNYPYQFTYDLNQNYSFGGSVISGIAQTTLVNPDIKWETSKTTNIGLDFSLLNGKLNFDADYFFKKTEGILVQLPFPATMGDKTNPYLNLAKFDNEGWEANIMYRDEIGSFKYSAGFNITQVKNKVTKYSGNVPYYSGPFIIREGLPLYTIYGYKNIGIIRTPEELAELNLHAVALSGTGSYYINNKTQAGDLKFEDQITVDTDNDGVADAKDGIINSADRVPIGNTIPKYMYGFNLNLEFKGIDLAVLFQGVYDVDSYLSGASVSPLAINGDRGLIPARWLDRWTTDNTGAAFPRLTNNKGYNFNDGTSSFWVQDASYLRLKSLQLGYSLPKWFNAKTNIEHVRIYLNGENLLTFTDFKGWDPERSQLDTEINYPNLRTITVGLQLTF